MTKKLWIFSWIWLAVACAGLITVIYINRLSEKHGLGLDKKAAAGNAPAAKPLPPANNRKATEISGQKQTPEPADEKMSELARQGKWEELTALLLARFSVQTNIVVGEEKETDYTPVDLSGEGTVRSIIEKILERFKDASSYQSPNDLAKQIISLGEDAIEPLLAMLQEYKDKHDQWAVRRAIEDALEGLLTEKHRDVIVKYFNEQNLFADLIKKYGFPEAKDSVMAKLMKWESGRTGDANAIVDAALKYDSARAVEILMAKMKEGHIIGNAAERLVSVPGLDMADTFREAAEKVQGNWDREKLLTPMLEKGMPESIDLALKILKTGTPVTEETDNYLRESVCRQISNYIGVIGPPDEIAAWLENNRGKLNWNPNTRHFEIIGGK